MSTPQCPSPATPGMFITLEGPEGSGKSTQALMLTSELERRGYTVHRTREPGGVDFAERLREVVLQAPTDPRAEALLFLAARAAHVEDGIRPALDRGEIVICDRFHHSTLAYQGYGLGLEVEELRRLCAFAGDGLDPEVVLLFDVPVSVGLARVQKGGFEGIQLSLAMNVRGEEGAPERRVNKMEERPQEFHQRVRQGFLTEARLDPDRIRVIDASREIEEVYASALAALEPLLPAPAD